MSQAVLNQQRELENNGQEQIPLQRLTSTDHRNQETCKRQNLYNLFVKVTI